jgi:outer membrane protein TolC
VKATADAGAELARRMQAVGNFSKLQRAREQSFAAEAVAQFARATQAARSSREALIRALGLNEQQAAALTLPDRLPDLPPQPMDEARVAAAAIDQRLDVRMAQTQLDFLAGEQGLAKLTSVVNGIELGVTRKSETGLAPQKGYELSVPVPIFDSGDSTRTMAQASTMAAVNRAAQISVNARSQVRESYGAYRIAYDIARHYRDEVVPLHKTIAEENVLRYNGMLIGVFELLADSREQVASVIQALDAQRDFWLADAALQATLIGTPVGPMAPDIGRSGAGSSLGRATND